MTELNVKSTVVEVTPDEALMHLKQREREEASRIYAQKKAREQQQRLAEAGMYGELDGSRKVVTLAVDDAIEGFERFLEEKHNPRSKTARLLPVFKSLSLVDRATLISDSLDLMLNSVDSVNLSSIIHRLGELVEVTVNFTKERKANSKLTQILKEKLEKQANAAGRIRTIKYELKVNTQTWERWDAEVKVVLGQILLHVIMDSTDLFDTETKEVIDSGGF